MGTLVRAPGSGRWKRGERNDGENKTQPRSLAETLCITGSVASAGAVLERGKKEFGLGWPSFKRRENVSEGQIFFQPVIKHTKIKVPIGTMQPIPDQI